MQHLAHEFKAMGTPCSFQLHAHGSEQLHRLAQQLIADIQRLEAKYSRYRPDSVLSQINHVAMSGGSVTVDEETGALLHYADTCFQQSGGLFDITSGVLAQVWHKGRTDVPSQAELDAPLARVGWGRLQWTGATLVFPLPGMQLDLGGIVKEYAADRLASMCREAGVHHGFINLGGDLCVVGPQPSGDPWLVGIRSPQDAAGDGTRVPVSVGAYAVNADNSVGYGGYATVDLNVAYKIAGRHEVYAAVANVGDKAYATSASVIGGTQVFAPGAPRTFKVGAKLQF